MPYDPDYNRHYFFSLKSMRLQLAALRSKQSGERFEGTPLGGDLRGPRQSEGYPRLLTEALQYALTWRGNAM